MKKILLSLAVLAWSACAALAQSYPNWTTGYVPTQAQWREAFSSKQDLLNYVPLNSAGGTMLGRLVTAAPSASVAGFNLTPGTAPGSPVNGDLWATSIGVFARVNGNTVQLGGTTTVGAATVMGNPTNATAAATAFTLASLVARGSPDANNDLLLIFDNTAGTLKKVTPGQVAAAATAGVSSIAGNTGVFTLSNGITNSGNDIRLASIAADSLLMNASGSSAIPSAKALPNCTALGYSTASHDFACASIPNGTVTSVGLLSGNGISISGGPITTSGNITVNVDKATAANSWAAVSNKVLTADVLFNGVAAYQTLSGTSSVTPDLSAGRNFTFQATSATNFTLQNPTNQIAGATGCIYITQPFSGTPVAISYGSQWFTPGGVASATLPSVLGNVARLCYNVVTPNALIDFSISSAALAH